VATLSTHDAPSNDLLADEAPETGARSLRSGGRRYRRPAPRSRVAYALGIATVCALVAVDLVAGGPAATANPEEQSASVGVADALGIRGSGTDVPEMEDPQLLEQLAASRSERDAEQAVAGAAQAQAEQAASAAKAEAEAKAAAEAAAAAATQAAAAAVAEAAGAAADSPAAAAAAAGTTATAVAKISNSAGGVRPQTQAAANAVVSNVPGAAGITLGGTRASATDPGGHPSGLALDYMVLSNEALGEAIVAYHIAHWDELGVEYLIYKQRMLSSPGGSWSGMEDRGSPTANHMDHVHVNYLG
jgi:hypothetical protein